MENIFKNTKQPFVMVDVSEVIPTVLDPINEELKDDILKNGMRNPLVVRKSDRLIMFGNERYVIFKSLGITQFPVRYKV